MLEFSYFFNVNFNTLLGFLNIFINMCWKLLIKPLTQDLPKRVLLKVCWELNN